MSDWLRTRVLTDGTVLRVPTSSIYNGQVTRASAQSDKYGTYDEVWSYPSKFEAMAAFDSWDGLGDAPVGWIRHQPSNRRREEGDPGRETVRP